MDEMTACASLRKTVVIFKMTLLANVCVKSKKLEAMCDNL